MFRGRPCFLGICELWETLPDFQRIRMGHWTAVAVINLAWPPKADNSLEEAILEARCVLHFPSTRPTIISLLYVVLQRYFGLKAQRRGIYHRVNKGTSDGKGSAQALFSLISLGPGKTLLKSPLEAGGRMSRKRESSSSPCHFGNCIKTISHPPSRTSRVRVECSMVLPQLRV